MVRARAVVVAVCLAVLCGCTPGDPPYVGVAATAMPTSLDDCNHISVEGDPGLGAGFHYDEDARHAFGESARLIVCIPPWRADWRSTSDVRQLMADDAAVTITPVSESPEDGVVVLALTVDGPADGTGTRMVMPGASFGGPSLRTDDTSWWFSSWGDDARD